eukprot:9472346-Pyramimonas_sp.AAC.1
MPRGVELIREVGEHAEALRAGDAVIYPKSCATEEGSSSSSSPEEEEKDEAEEEQDDEEEVGRGRGGREAGGGQGGRVRYLGDPFEASYGVSWEPLGGLLGPPPGRLLGHSWELPGRTWG